jgi:hypothetical protein
VYPEQLPSSCNPSKNYQDTKSHDPHKTRYCYQGSAGQRGGHTTQALIYSHPIDTLSTHPVHPSWRLTLPTLEGEASDGSTAATKSNSWEEARSPQPPPQPSWLQEFQPLPNLHNKPNDQFHPNITCSPAFYARENYPSMI